MNKIKNLNIWFATSIFLSAVMSAAAGGRTIYVDADALGPTHDGSSWANAFRYLQDALVVSVSSDKIWVAEGVYKPDRGIGITAGDRRATFPLKNGVTIYGGFAGVETGLDQRDWQTNETILSGDLSGNDADIADPAGLLGDPTRAENSYRVVTGSGTNSTAFLDGFTITAGNANGAYPDRYGSGMYNGYYSGPTVTNCIFSANSASQSGGGMSNVAASPTVTNCTFRDNWAGGGGGMDNQQMDSPTVTDCTFSGNRAGQHGGGMYNYRSTPTVTNCILWGDTVGTVGPEIALRSTAYPSTLAISHSDVQGGAAGVYVETGCTLNWGAGNIDADPVFVDAGNGDYHLLPGSPCIDAGTNTPPGGLAPTDIEGNPRPFDGDRDGVAAADMGAYEAIPVVRLVIDIKPGSYPNAINLGSYGLIPVAILSSADFDATTVNPDTVELAGAGVAVRGKGIRPWLTKGT